MEQYLRVLQQHAKEPDEGAVGEVFTGAGRLKIGIDGGESVANTLDVSVDAVGPFARL